MLNTTIKHIVNKVDFMIMLVYKYFNCKLLIGCSGNPIVVFAFSVFLHPVNNPMEIYLETTPHHNTNNIIIDTLTFLTNQN